MPSSTEPGARVWAIQNTTKTHVYVYGFGTYLGDRLPVGWDDPATIERCRQSVVRFDAEGPPIDHNAYAARLVADGKMTQAEADAWIAEVEAGDAVERARPLDDRVWDFAELAGRNPYILLDSGVGVWGFQCWWTVADDTTPTRYAQGREIITVPVESEVAMTARRVQVSGDYFHGRVPGDAVYIGRGAPGLPGSKWANRFVAGRTTPTYWTAPFGGVYVRDPVHAVALYRQLAEQSPAYRAEARAELRGRNLACWCARTEVCHGDVLLEIANSPDEPVEEGNDA